MAELRDEVRVRSWRFDVLYKAGYDMADAKLIARRDDIDLHYAVEVLRKCADSKMARRLVL